jgi:mitogen-activated protein kinase 1/3
MARELGFFENNADILESKNISQKVANELKNVERPVNERLLSPHITSRWYRAPEVILMEKDYEFGVDIWAVGCTFAELVLCSKPYLKNLSKKSQRDGVDLAELIDL